MCTTGLKKTPNELLKSGKSGSIFELDELYWFIERKAKSETRENVYLMTMINPESRQIVGLEVAMDKGAAHIQNIVDSAELAEKYATDGYYGYLDVVFPGEHIRNVHNKNDTHNVESINADLRHYIPVLARRSRCFCRSLETLQAVVEVFVDAYNAFGVAKLRQRIPTQHKPSNEGKHLHHFRELPFSVLDFL
jgi:IS1 family transposase